MKGIDTTDKVVYGHEAWITTDKNNYLLGETMKALLRWGHNMRPDGFCRLDEISVFLIDPERNKLEITPQKGKGDYYELEAVLKKEGLYNLVCIYDNIYARTENDEYFEGTRREYPDVKDVIDYQQIYTTCFNVGTFSGDTADDYDVIMQFVPIEHWKTPEIGSNIRLSLYLDGKSCAHASSILIFFDGTEYYERMMATDKNGEIFFLPKEKGTYCLINRTDLDESEDGVYDMKSLTVSFTFVV